MDNKIVAACFQPKEVRFERFESCRATRKMESEGYEYCKILEYPEMIKDEVTLLLHNVFKDILKRPDKFWAEKENVSLDTIAQQYDYGNHIINKTVIAEGEPTPVGTLLIDHKLKKVFSLNLEIKIKINLDFEIKVFDSLGDDYHCENGYLESSVSCEKTIRIYPKWETINVIETYYVLSEGLKEKTVIL